MAIILGIHSNVAGDNAALTAGHAWLSITQSGITTTYGLWPDSHPNVIDNGPGSDIRVGLESNVNAVASRYYSLTDAQANHFNRMMGTNVNWQYTHNCSSFASDLVYEIVREDIDADDTLGLETPREIGKSILLLEARRPTSLLTPRPIVKGPAGTPATSSSN
ncbi:hypothetical protein MNBD_GAMMA10-2873 [hydrothermal vent metagenome]|uniref:Uncharacterized protein n=1 Tax=hydrothermal vent metagenome TaxID=652676 RepID=A0A3B0XI09_9ZZZZ